MGKTKDNLLQEAAELGVENAKGLAYNDLRSAVAKARKAATTEDVERTPQETEIVELYNSGANHYQIADEVFGFNSDEALEKVDKVLKAEAARRG